MLYSDGLLSLQAGADTEDGHGSLVAQWDWDGASSPWSSKADHIRKVVARDRVPVYDASGLFYKLSCCRSMDLGNLDVSSAEDLSHMFYGCSSLETLDLSGWYVSSAEDLSHMFYECSSLSSVTLGVGCGNLVDELPSGPWYDAAGTEHSAIPASALPGTFTKTKPAAQADAAEAALFDEVGPLSGDAAAVPEGLLYTVVAGGPAYELGIEYAELGGRYVGPGAYVTGYAGQADALELPLEIDGSPVVSADLSWDDGDRAGMTRLSGVAFERAEGKASSLAQLDVSGNALAALDLSGLDALVRLNCEGNPIADLSQLQAWAAQEGHQAALPQASASEGDAADGSAASSESQADDGTADSGEAFDTVAPDDAEQSGEAGGADGADAAVQPSDSDQAGDTEGAGDGDQVDGSIESSGSDQADGTDQADGIDQTGDIDQSDGTDQGTDSDQAGDSPQVAATDLEQVEAPSGSSGSAEADAVAEETWDGSGPSDQGGEALAQAA